MTRISIDDARHVARLARVGLDDDQLLNMTDELDVILEHIAKVGELDLSEVPPTTHALEVVDVLGDDEPHVSLSRELALRGAPDAQDGCFRVPRMQS